MRAHQLAALARRPTGRRMSCRALPGGCVARLRPDRVVLQRKHREAKVADNTEVLDYLRSLGLDRVACMLVFAKANESLFWESASTRRAPAEDEEAEEEDDVLTKPRCEAVATFLLELGLSPASLPEIITQHPPLLAYDVEARLRPLAAYLASLGIAGPRFVAALVARPSLLGLTAEKHKKMVDYLLSTEVDVEKVREYVLTTL